MAPDHMRCLMAPDHMRSSGEYEIMAASNGNSQGFGKQGRAEALTEEDKVLSLLMEAFPGISLKDLAHAYIVAEGDPNNAAEILALGTGQNGHGSRTKYPPQPSCDDNAHLSNGVGPIVHERTRNGGVLQEMSPDERIFSHYSPPDRPIYSPFVQPKVLEDLTVHSDKQNEISRCRSKLSAAAAVYEYQGNSSCKVSGAGSAGNSAREKSAITGSVSSRMQRRQNSSNGHESREMADWDGELNDCVYSWKRKKKKMPGRGQSDEDPGPDEAACQRDKEEFVHTMFGGEPGIDVVRDVLGHFAGDSDKAIETLLNMGSTAESGNPDKIESRLGNFLGYEDNHKGEINVSPEDKVHDANGHSLKDPSTACEERYVERLLEGLDPRMKALLGRLCEAFPTVEHNYLAAVLELAEFSYPGAVNILKEAGMTPVTSQNSLDAREVLQSLFKADNEPKDELSGPPTETHVASETSEPWNVVAARPRIRRNTDVKVVAERLKDNAHGYREWNEYTRHRTIASAIFEDMKNCMKAACAAYNEGDRTRAKALSEEGNRLKQLAQEAGNRASHNIFNVQNKDIENNIKIDLHAQHVPEAMKLLKLHLRSLSRIPSVHVLTVVTGQGSHSAGGRSRLKPAITKYLDKKKILWKEANPGCLLVSIVHMRVGDSTGDIPSCSSAEDSS